MASHEANSHVESDESCSSGAGKALGQQYQVKEIPGDLFDAPDGSALIHSCNALGHWGKGIACTFKAKYPAAYRIHVGYCKSHTKTPMAHDIPVLQAPDGRTVSTRLPLGTAQIIAPQPSDARLGEKRYWIICLFTSYAYGGRADPVDQIINNTHAALQDLQRQLRELHEKGAAAPDALYACRFNSGLFAVPWAKTRKLIEDVGPEMTVVYPVNDVNV